MLSPQRSIVPDANISTRIFSETVKEAIEKCALQAYLAFFFTLGIQNDEKGKERTWGIDLSSFQIFCSFAEVSDSPRPGTSMSSCITLLFYVSLQM